MTTIFIFGASGAYGVGAERAGWADLLKQSLHSKMYGDKGIGMQYMIYNFGRPDVLAEFVLATFANQLKLYRGSGKVIAIVCIGGNNVRAINTPDNFVSTPQEYEQTMHELLEKLRQDVDELLVLPSIVAVDESRTSPKLNPLTGMSSYFTNDRIAVFNAALKNLCGKLGVRYVDITVSPEEWAKQYLWADGMHPNQRGHEYIFEKVSAEVEKLIP